MCRKQTNCNYLFAWHDSKWRVWVTPELVDEPRRASFSRDRDSFANRCKWFLPFEHATGKYQVAENTRVCWPCLWKPRKIEKDENGETRRESASSLDSQCTYAESCGPPSPASAGFPRSFCRLSAPLSSSPFFSLSRVLEVRTVITPHLPSRSSASCIHWPRLHTSSRGYAARHSPANFANFDLPRYNTVCSPLSTTRCFRENFNWFSRSPQDPRRLNQLVQVIKLTQSFNKCISKIGTLTFWMNLLNTPDGSDPLGWQAPSGCDRCGRNTFLNKE